MSILVIRALFALFLLWQLVQYASFPSEVPSSHWNVVVASAVSLERDETNWRAVAGESGDERRVRQMQLVVVGSDGRTWRLACRDIEPTCDHKDIAQARSLQIALLPDSISDRSWAMRVNLRDEVVVSEATQKARLREKKQHRQLLLGLSIACFVGAFYKTGRSRGSRRSGQDGNAKSIHNNGNAGGSK